MTEANCHSDEVGPDLQVALPAGARQVRFNWLREVLQQAAKSEAAKSAASNAKPTKAEPSRTKSPQVGNTEKNTDSADDDGTTEPPTKSGEIARVAEEFPSTTTEERLTYARTRLAADDQIAAKWAEDSVTKPTAPNTQQRAALTRILSAKEYRTTVVGPSLMDRFKEKLALWINRVLGKLANTGAKSKWFGTAAEIGFGIVLCVALVWFLIRLEKQGRFGSGLIPPGPGSGAASARDWQLWLQDAHTAAAQGAWRDAIHLLYWASISRLESSGLWPADRARTPREYLALLSQESQHRPDLSALTRSFESTWYAGRSAAEDDFRKAEQLAGRLGAR
jgi:hypothetical protein